MRKYGEIGNVYFISQGYNIYNLATEYKLTYDGETVFVYMNNMTELKKEITNLITEGFHEQDQV